MWTVRTLEFALPSARRATVEYAEHVVPGAASSLPTVLALHCSGSNYKQWTALAQALESRPIASRLVAPNLFGSGNTTPWSGRPLTLDDQVALARICADDDARVVGHSHGGSIALRYACLHPTSRVVVVEPNAFHFADKAPFKDAREAGLRARGFVEQLHRSAQNDFEDWGRLFYNFWFDGDWDALDANSQRRLVGTVPHTLYEVQSILGAYGDAAQRDLDILRRRPENSLSLLVAPTPGRGSKLCLAALESLFANVLHARVAKLPVGDHLAPITHPIPTAEAILDCLT